MSLRRNVGWGLALAIGAMLVAVVVFLFDRINPLLLSSYTIYVAMFLVAVGVLAGWFVYGAVVEHINGIDRLRAATIALAVDERAVVPTSESLSMDVELNRLHGALSDWAASVSERSTAPDQRLQAVVASMAQAIMVITDAGQVSLVNHSARELLGAQRVKVGTSAFAALTRESVVLAMTTAQGSAGACDATLVSVSGDVLQARVVALEHHGGAVICIDVDAPTVPHRSEIECDLTLHDQLPSATEISSSTMLNELPVLVLDTETTGLDATNDRVISIGAVRVHGKRIYRGVAFDRLVNPARSIPRRSSAVHGITDAMVRDAPNFDQVFSDFMPMMRHVVVVGHNVAFDLAMLRRECELAQLPWQEPVSLDTLALASALNLGVPSLHLETLAEYLSVDVHGRHTALGDSLVTAEVYLRLLNLLQEHSVATLGEAQRFAARAKALAMRQKRAGW